MIWILKIDEKTACRTFVRVIGIIIFITLTLFGSYYFYEKNFVGNPDPLTNELVESKSLNRTENKSFDHFFMSPSYLPPSPFPSNLLSLSPPASIKPKHESLSFNFTEMVQRFALAKEYRSPISPSDHSWCTTEHFSKHKQTGILYNKMPKAASSTMAGITIRIAHKVASRIYGRIHDSESVCTNRFTHIGGLNKPGELFLNRDRSRSFLFSTLRDPAKRSISRIFFSQFPSIEKIITKKKVMEKKEKKKKKKDKDKKMKKNKKTKKDVFDEVILDKLRTEKIDHQFGVTDIKRGGFQVAYTITNVSDSISVYNPSHPAEISDLEHVVLMVRQILSDYDFMIIVERYDECIVLMQLLLGLETSDVMYLSAKQSGGYYDHKGTCKKITKSVISPGVSEFLSSKDWYARNYADYLLIEAASQSIDLTIDAIGRKQFEEAFETFQDLKKRARKECEDKVVFPCNSKGRLQEKEAAVNCYTKDEGCGYPCLDAM